MTLECKLPTDLSDIWISERPIGTTKFTIYNPVDDLVNFSLPKCDSHLAIQVAPFIIADTIQNLSLESGGWVNDHRIKPGETWCSATTGIIYTGK